MASEISYHIVRNPRARRLILRLPAQGDRVEVVAPPRATQREIAGFVHRHESWLEDRLARRPPSVPFAAGETIPFAGEPHRIECTGRLRGTVSRGEGVIRVPSLEEHLPRRLGDYLRKEARAAIAASLVRTAALLSRTVPPFSLRDTVSRWGSCSARGTLSFSWRLILMPPAVLDYIVAHEAAHLVHMNHGQEFWRLCRRLAPQTDTARAWLKANGARLHRYG